MERKWLRILRFLTFLNRDWLRLHERRRGWFHSCGELVAPLIVWRSGKPLQGQDIKLGIYARTTFRDEIKNHALSVKKQGVIFDVIVKYNDGIHVKPEEEKKISLTIINKLRRQRWVTVKWHLLPEEWDVSPCRETAIFLDQAHGGTAVTYAEFVITPHTMKHGRNDFILELKANGSVGTMFIPITLFS